MRTLSGSDEPVRRPERANAEHDGRQLRIGGADEDINDQVRRQRKGDRPGCRRQQTVGPDQQEHEEAAKPPQQHRHRLVCDRERQAYRVKRLDKVIKAHLVEIEQRLAVAGANALGPADRPLPLPERPIEPEHVRQMRRRVMPLRKIRMSEWQRDRDEHSNKQQRHEDTPCLSGSDR